MFLKGLFYSFHTFSENLIQIAGNNIKMNSFNVSRNILIAFCYNRLIKEEKQNE